MMYRWLVVSGFLVSWLVVFNVGAQDVASQTEDTTLYLLPMAYDQSVPDAEVYAQNFDLSLADELRNLPKMTIQHLTATQLPANYADMISRNFQNPVSAACQLMSSLQGRYFVVSLAAKPVNGAISLYSWVFNTRTGRELARAESSGPFDLSSGLRGQEVARQLLSSLATVNFSQLANSFLTQNQNASQSITFTSQFGDMEIDIANGQKLGDLTAGSLTVYQPIERRTNLQITLKKDGYYPTSKTFNIDGSNPTIDVGDLYPKHLYRLSVYWSTNLQTAGGLTLTGFFNDDEYLLWELGLGLYARPVTGYADQTATQAYNFYPEVFYGLGTYIVFPPTSVFRLYLKTGLGLMTGLPATPAATISNDLFLKPVVLGMELNLAPVSLGYELYWRYYLGVFDSSLFRLGWDSNSARLDVLLRLKL
jgi:hypothetical protein